MSYSKVEPQPAARSPALAYEDIGPGLYPGETMLKLGTGELVAVSVETTWTGNNSGLVIAACARRVNADASTFTCAAGQHVETEIRHTCDAAQVQAHGAAVLAKEAALLVLGEPPTMVSVPSDEGDVQAPLIAWSDEMRLNASIVHAAGTAAATNAPIDAASILDL